MGLGTQRGNYIVSDTDSAGHKPSLIAASREVDPHTVPTRTRLAFGVGATAEYMSLYSLTVLGLLFGVSSSLGVKLELIRGLLPHLADREQR